MLVGGLLELFEAGIIRREIDGAAIHAGFFVEARGIYQRLRAMNPDQRAKIAMMPVSFTNALYGDEPAKRNARTQARFVNGAMQVSLLGDVMSDAAKPGQVVSGVGGQFNFIEQAFALKDGRAILTLPATRHSGGAVTSNIIWQLPLTTVPRHMRTVDFRKACCTLQKRRARLRLIMNLHLRDRTIRKMPFRNGWGSTGTRLCQSSPSAPILMRSNKC